MKRPIHLKIIHRNRIFRESLAAVLSADDRFQVAPVDHTDADELAAIEQSRPDVVLIDLNLPDQLALELTRHVHERVDSAKVILLTHANSREDLVECFEAGLRVACWRNPRSTIFGRYRRGGRRQDVLFAADGPLDVRLACRECARSLSSRPVEA